MRRMLTALSAAVLVAGLFVPDAIASAPAAPVGVGAGAALRPHLLTLPTGQRVMLHETAAGQPVAGPVPGSPWAADDPVLEATMRGDVYAFPRSAIPYLGHQLDVSLFDLSRLAGVERSDGTGQIPVSTTAAALPGVTVTGPGTGYLSTSSAGDFGAALRMDPLPADARLSLAGAAFAATTASAGSNLWTLTIDAVDSTGAAAFGVLIQLVNVDDASRFSITTGIGVSPAKLSVPDGHYSLTAIFITFENGRLVFRTDVHPQFTVRGATTVLADARRATTEPTTVMPRAADLTVETLTVARLAKQNGGIGIFSVDQPSPGGPRAQFLVSPTASVTTGQLLYDTYEHYNSPDGGASFTYDLDFPVNGAIPAQQAHIVDDSQLAAIHASYDSELDGQVAAAGRGILSGGGFTFLGFTALYPLALPTSRTEYVSAGPDVHWNSELLRTTTGSFTDWFEDAIRTYRPGTSVSAEWMRQPIHPGVHRLGDTPFLPLVCPACRQGDHFNLIIEPYADDVPGHVAIQPTRNPSTGETASGAYQLSQDGQPIASGEYLDGVQIPVSADPATYQLTYDVNRTAPWWTLSTSTHTAWTFRSGHSQKSLSDNGWFCDFTAATDCQFLPMIFADYDLPTGATGHEAAGPTSATVHAYYLQPKGMPSIQSVRFDASFDDGQTWQPAAVTDGGDGQFHVTYSNPAVADTNGFAALRVVVTDSAGGQLAQTIQRAYSIS